MDVDEDNDVAVTAEDTSFFTDVLGDAAFLTRMKLPYVPALRPRSRTRTQPKRLKAAVLAVALAYLEWDGGIGVAKMHAFPLR